LTKLLRPGGVCLSLLIILLYGPTAIAVADTESNDSNSSHLDRHIEDGLSYLLSMVQQPGAVMDAARIDALLDYAGTDASGSGSCAPDKRAGGAGVCVGTGIEAPLERILRYAYNPQIPSYTMMPQLLRLSGWYPDSDLVVQNIKLWEALDGLDEPLLLRGREYEVTTPDTSTGGYYRYDLDRLLILMKHRGHPVMISVSKMVRPSDVGKRAVIVDDGNWTYFYSGQKGLSLHLLKWMDTFIYDASSVLIFKQTRDQQPHTKATLFKWLNAGWRGMNVVNPAQIRAGSVRFVQNMKQIVEFKDLPDAAVIARQYYQIRHTSISDLDGLIQHYALNFEQLAKARDAIPGDQFDRLVSNGGYARLLNREERIGVIMLECMKHYVGKTPLIPFDRSGAMSVGFIRERNTHEPVVSHRVSAGRPGTDSSRIARYSPLAAVARRQPQ
jgi:hypothetical protein